MTRARDLSFLANVITAGTNVVVGGGLSVSGIVTANKFIGDGSGLSNIVASGSGVVIRNNGSLVGTATTIDFGTGLTVTPLSVGIVTVNTSNTSNTSYASTSGISTNVKGTGGRVLYNSSTDTTTTSSNLTFDGTTLSVNSTPGANVSSVYLTGTPFGSNTKNGLFGIGQLGFNDSNIIANLTANVNSYAQVILQNLSTGNAASSDFIVNSDSPLGQTYYGDFGINGTAYDGGGPFGDKSGTYLYSAGGTLSVGSKDAYDFRIATGSAFDTPVTRVTVAAITGNVGIGTTNPTSTLTVGGGTSTTNLYVSGVSTFTGDITLTDFTLFAKQLNISGISTFNGNVRLGGNKALYFGSNNEFFIYRYEGTPNNRTVIYNSNNDIVITSPQGLSIDNGNNTFASFVPSGSALYHGAGDIPAVTLRYATTDYGSIVYKDFSVKVNNGNDLFVVKNPGSGLTQDAKVGIATTNPTSTLTVGGDLSVSGVTTSSGGFVGNLTGTATAAGYATTSGISTVSQGLTGSPNITVGVITATNVTIGTATTALIVNGNTRISGATTITGNLNAPGNYYVKLARLTNQTIPTGTDTLIGFTATSDTNGWYSGITTRTTPKVAGNYYVSAMLNWQSGATTNVNQSNIQARKNGNTFAISIVGIQTFQYSQFVCGIVTMNGTTDYIDFTAYTSNATSQGVNGESAGLYTKMEIFKLN